MKLIPKELTEIINNSSTARLINQEEQLKYEEACKSYGEKEKVTLSVNSNLFKVLLLNQIGIRTATLPELGIILESNPNFLKDHYEDAPSVVLRSNEDSHKNNDYLAKQLTEKLKIRNFKTPYIINGLKIKEDNNSYYGLSFNTKDAEIIKAPELNYLNNQKKFLKLNKKGMPIFDEKGTRIFYTRDNGLSRLCLYGDLGLGSWGEGLAGSNSAGRVVIVSDVAKNFESYLNNLKIEKQRYRKNLKVLRDQIDKEIKDI